jgi:hypothetical protein
MVFPEVLRSFREHPEARRLALIFAVVYFTQGMLFRSTWHSRGEKGHYHEAVYL